MCEALHLELIGKLEFGRREILRAKTTTKARVRTRQRCTAARNENRTIFIFLVFLRFFVFVL